jgi:YNFM family putative membrane transporter
MELTSQSARSRSESSFLRLFAIWLCGFCPFLAVYATQPLLPTLAKIFLASENDVSLTITATTLAVAITAPFIGLLSDAVGRKVVIVGAIFGLSVPMALAATSTSLDQLVIWRFVQGLFIPGIFSIALAYIGEEWEGKNRGLATAAYISGNVFGSVSGRVVSGLVATYAGWHMSFIALAGLLLLGGVGVWILLPRSQNFVPHRDMRSGLRAMAAHFKNRQLLAVCAIGFNTLFVFVGVFTYITFHLSTQPFSLSTAALGLMFLLNLFGAVVTPFAGRWMDRVGYRTGLCSALLASALGVALTLTSSLVIVFFGLALVSMGVFVANSAASSQLGRITGKARSSAAGLYVCSYYVGGSVGAVAPGFAYAWGGWWACVSLILLIMLVSAIIALRFWAKDAVRQ